MPIWSARFLTRHRSLLLVILALVYILYKRPSRIMKVNESTMEEYAKEYEASIVDWENYWRTKAHEYLTWYKPFSSVYSGYC